MINPAEIIFAAMVASTERDRRRRPGLEALARAAGISPTAAHFIARAIAAAGVRLN